MSDPYTGYDYKRVNAMVKIALQIERNTLRLPKGDLKVKELCSDLSRLWKMATNYERSEYQKRVKTWG